MPKKHQIKFTDFLKVTAKYIEHSFPKHNIVPKKGSGIRFELFENDRDATPSKMWVVHRDKFVHKGDLKKTCLNLGLTEEEFLGLI